MGFVSGSYTLGGGVGAGRHSGGVDHHDRAKNPYSEAASSFKDEDALSHYMG